MNISRDVVIDLLPLYVSGEASPATQELVRGFLAQDPELAKFAREQEALPGAITPLAGARDVEAISFGRTRRRIVAQRWAFGLAWLFTAITFSTRIETVGGNVTGARLALIDAPLVLGMAGAAAAVSWLIYLKLRNRG